MTSSKVEPKIPGLRRQTDKLCAPRLCVAVDPVVVDPFWWWTFLEVRLAASEEFFNYLLYDASSHVA